MSNKIKNVKENTEKGSVKFLSQSGVVIAVLCCFTLLVIGFLISALYNSLHEASLVKKALYEVVAPDFDSMEAAMPVEETTDKVDGMIGFDAFRELRKEAAEDGLASSRGVLGDKLYVDFLNGLESDYYKKSIEYEYDELLSQMDTMLKQAGLMEALYNTYAQENEMPVVAECALDNCELFEFITDYTKGEVHDYLLKRHDMWESVLQVETNRTNVEDSYTEFFYQDSICKDLKYVSKINLEVMLLTKQQFDMGYDFIQENYTNGNLKTVIYDESNKSYFEGFDLYKDIDFYDDGFKDLASKTFQAQFASEIVKGSTYLMSGEVGDVKATNSNLVDKLKGMEVPKEDVKDYTKIENWNVESMHLTDRNDADIMYILWKIVPGSCEHTLEIPSFESVKEEMTREAQLYMADRLVSDTLFAELNQLTDMEVRDMLVNNYGYTEEELGSLSEDELREALEEEEQKMEQDSSNKISDIRTHMEADGYTISGMTDEEVISLYNENHANN